MVPHQVEVGNAGRLHGHTGGQGTAGEVRLGPCYDAFIAPASQLFS